MFDLNKNGKIDNWEVIVLMVAAAAAGTIVGLLI